jgi:hypothetical protein
MPCRQRRAVISRTGEFVLRNDQIVALCDALLKATTENEAVELASRLQAALHEHVETIRGNLLVSIAQEVPDDMYQSPDPQES